MFSFGIYFYHASFQESLYQLSSAEIRDTVGIEVMLLMAIISLIREMRRHQ